ncbi:MAG: hypothetical protein H6R18_1222 [Proteobacteria bacterium]|nr:hypothetical protein [Pseudomonadota bacterium]
MRYPVFRSLALTLLVLAWPLLAAAKPSSQPDPVLQADWDRRLEESKAQQNAGKAQKASAKQLFESEKVACFKKFRVTDCQEDARRRYLITTNEARRIENEGLAKERRVKKEQLEDKDKRYLAEAPERAADRAKREAETTENRKKTDEKIAQKLADKQKKTSVGADRRARDAERLEKKRLRHEKKVAEQMEKAKRRETEKAAVSK